MGVGRVDVFKVVCVVDGMSCYDSVIWWLWGSV